MKIELDVVRTADADGDVRVLRRLNLETGPTGLGLGRGDHVCSVIDVETTGLDVDRDATIEIAIRRFRYDRDGVITDVDRAYEWREDPGFSIPPHITALTGIGDADVVGRRIDRAAATRLLSGSLVCLAHHARFDRRWVERLLPELPALPWICSMEQVDWRARGFDGRGLGYLLTQAGWFHDGHRASADVDATIRLMMHAFPDGTTAFQEARARGGEPTWMVRARGAPFEVKDELKVHGYRWDGKRSVWWRELSDAEREPEEWWLAANVCDLALKPKAMEPEIEEITAFERFP